MDGARLIRRATALAVLLLAGRAVQAADPQPYTVTLDTTGQAALDQALADASRLLGLRETAPVGPFALITRAQEDLGRWRDALRSFGYYQGQIDLKIDGRAPDDPGLTEALEKAPAEPPVPVKASFTLGPLFHLGRIELQGPAPEHAADGLGLQSGAPALAPEVLAARQRLLDALRAQGYALAQVEAPVATLREETRTLDLSFTVNSGPRVDLGAIAFQGLEGVNEAFARQRLRVHEGERYDPAALEQARRDLLALGVFSSVRVRDADRLDAEGRLPVTFEVVERKQRAVNLGAAYSTDLGGSFSATWQHRNLFGNAEQLNFITSATQLGGNSTTGVGYNLVLAFSKPDFWRRDQALQASVGAIQQSLTAYDRQAFTGEVLLNRKFAEHWQASLGLAGEQERVTQEGDYEDFTLLSLPATLKYDSTNSLLDPTEGLRGAVLATPTQPLAGPQRTPFVLLQVSGSAYLDLGEPGRSVLAVRGLIGDALGVSASGLPADKRFYAGGSATVRGYKYLSIGPKFDDDKPRGGTAVVAGTLEFRQRFLESYGAVVFLDAGQVTANGLPFTGTLGVGAGLGARYYTSIGPIRLDVALPVNKQPGSGSFEVYIGLGQAF